MKNRKSGFAVAGAGALAVLVTTTAFAAPQRGDDRGRDNDRGRTESRNSTYRDNQRVNASGRVTSFSRESGGYRVHLDRGRDSSSLIAAQTKQRLGELFESATGMPECRFQ